MQEPLPLNFQAVKYNRRAATIDPVWACLQESGASEVPLLSSPGVKKPRPPRNHHNSFRPLLLIFIINFGRTSVGGAVSIHQTFWPPGWQGSDSWVEQNWRGLGNSHKEREKVKVKDYSCFLNKRMRKPPGHPPLRERARTNGSCFPFAHLTALWSQQAAHTRQLQRVNTTYFPGF